MTTCTHPGCRARVMREGPCSRHRPKVPHVRTPEQRVRESRQELARYHAKVAVARIEAGAMGGAEGNLGIDNFGRTGPGREL